MGGDFCIFAVLLIHMHAHMRSRVVRSEVKFNGGQHMDSKGVFLLTVNFAALTEDNMGAFKDLLAGVQ